MQYPSTSAAVVDTLRSLGHRITPVRQAIVELFFSHDRPVSAADIMDMLKKQHKTVNKTTVYREIDFLVAQGFVTVVRVDQSKMLYERYGAHHHHHVVCSSCGAIEDIASKTLERSLAVLEQAVTQDTGYVVSEHSVELFGLCPSCARRKR